ncbi:MAG: hypothetical protein H7A35_05205 [Planctomycetales bacterium]|nr:hypothetical protein [bacterium]UNM09454.1 MAG: hypothetical protein H7A35_05205 [Planctomycetales bacterium]
MDTRFGHPDDWGLSPQRHSEIASELSDHLDCLQADEGSDAARAAEAKLAEPKVRRKLSAAHIADQVVATLHRKPNREEWRELGWLMFWFALALLGDALSGYLQGISREYSRTMYNPGVLPNQFSPLAISCWLLLAISRGMFFYVLARGVLDAWRLGLGVLIARLLQYKLIHTLILFGGLILLEPLLTEYGYSSVSGRLDGVFAWITVMLGGVMLAGIIAGFLMPRWRRAGIPAMLSLVLVFLWTTGPSAMRRVDVTQPYPVQDVREDSESIYLGAVTDLELIEKKMASHVRTNGKLPPGWSLENPVVAHWTYKSPGPFLNARRNLSMHSYGYGPYPLGGKPRVIIGEEITYGPLFATAPLMHPGSGIAWIAAPVPIMGILGLFAMLFIMGRRGPLPAVLYALLTCLALYCSVVPFVLTQKYQNLLELSTQAFAFGPFPGFEQILTFRYSMDGYMIMGALLLSAGIPWLLTGLFLRSESSNARPVDDDADLATG